MKKSFINGKFYINKNEFAEAIFIENEIIKKIGTNEEILSIYNNQVINLNNKTIIPGLNDSHLHLSVVGNSLSQLQLYGSTSIDEVISKGRKYIDEKPNETFIYGRGWNQDYFTTGEKRLLNRYDLDKISTQIPIICERVCVHVISCNSKALELLNINPDTSIEGGEIYRDENNQPLGIFTENAAIKVREIVPKDTPVDIENKFLLAAKHAIENGLTSVQSCDIMMTDDWNPTFATIKNIYDNKKTKLRYYPQFNFNSIQSLKDYINTNYYEDFYNDYFQKGSIKLFKDGSLGARTALLYHPYNDDKSTNGVEALDNEFIGEVCQVANEHKIRVITHAIGDAAIGKTIDVYENYFINGTNDLRHGIVHCQITDSELLNRISNLNINVMFQPVFLEYDITMVEDRVGKKLASTSYAHNTLYNKLGVHTAFGTDSPVESLNPFECMYSAVTRQRKNGFPEKGFYPEERISIEDAIDCYTIESAYCEGNENVKGRIMENFFADFIVLDRDIFTIESHDIKNVKVLETYIGGELVYKRV